MLSRLLAHVAEDDASGEGGDPNMSHTEFALLDPLQRCAKASQLIYAGKFEKAKDALAEFWRGLGERPKVENYPPHIKADILLQSGSLSGFLGDAKGKDVQCMAKPRNY